MAPVQLYEDLSLTPMFAVIISLLAGISGTSLIASTIYRSYLALPPSSATRHRQDARTGHIKIFAGLATLSLILASYWGYSTGTLSYRVWAAERGIALPGSLFGETGAFRGGEHPGRLQLNRWLNDTPIYQDAREIIAEKARRYWWGQQIDLATTSWSMLLAIEGRRRKIPHLWAFLLLAQTISLSFAQNLFYIAVLLTPVPLPDNLKELTQTRLTNGTNRYDRIKSRILLSKPENWCPHPILYLLPLTLSLGGIFLTPFASNTPSFMTVTAMSRAFNFVPLFLHCVVPESFGTVHPHPHDAHSAYTKLFRAVSVISGLLHGKSTALALLYNTPASHYHRHTLLHPFREEHRGVLEQGSTAIGKVLGAVGDHPAVSAVGWDAILSGLSLGIWAALRGLGWQEILSGSGLWSTRQSKSVGNVVAEAKSELSDLTSLTKEQITTSEPTARRRGRPKKSDSENQDESSSKTPAKRIRSRKTEPAGEKAYQPDEVAHIEGDEDDEEDWEAGALTWGLIAVGGLGIGSAGVFSAETTAR